MNKKDVIQLLETIALYLEIKGENSFKISAYRKAAKTLETDKRSLEEIDDLETLKGIGKKTASVISEFIETNESRLLVELEKEIPATLLQLLKIPGLGGKKIAKLYQELHIEDIVMLEEACKNGLVQSLPGFGKKTEEKILTAIEEIKYRPERLPIAYMLKVADLVEQTLRAIPEIILYSRGGSLRRMEETIKDVDFILATEQPSRVREQLLMMPNIKEVIANGDTKVSVTLHFEYDVNVDFRLVSKEEYPTTLHHFTGSKEHNVRMRQLAKARGEKISEYGVTVQETGEVITFSSEEAFYQHFDLHYIPPACRQGTDEIERFQKNASYITQNDIKSDLHMHTTWSDGAHSISEMAEACRKKGYQYMVITDHSQFLKVADGLTEEEVRQQQKEIEEINAQMDDFHIFTGIEMDILPDGSLDYSDETLAQLDFVIASIHSSFNQTKEQIKKRLERALYNPYVSMIAHPTGRLLGRREGYQVDVDWLINVAKETNTILECNANPHRLDLSSEWLQKAKQQGVSVALNTDSHHIGMLDDMKYGIALANRAGLQTEHIVNTWEKEKFVQFVQKKRRLAKEE